MCVLMGAESLSYVCGSQGVDEGDLFIEKVKTHETRSRTDSTSSNLWLRHSNNSFLRLHCNDRGIVRDCIEINELIDLKSEHSWIHCHSSVDMAPLFSPVISTPTFPSSPFHDLYRKPIFDHKSP